MKTRIVVDRITKLLELKLNVYWILMKPGGWRHNREVRLYIGKRHGRATLEKFLAHHSEAKKLEKKGSIHKTPTPVEENRHYQALKREAFNHLETKGVVRHTHNLRSRLHAKTA